MTRRASLVDTPPLEPVPSAILVDTSVLMGLGATGTDKAAFGDYIATTDKQVYGWYKATTWWIDPEAEADIEQT